MERADKQKVNLPQDFAWNLVNTDQISAVAGTCVNAPQCAKTRENGVLTKGGQDMF